MFFEIFYQVGKDLDHRILGFIFVLEVFDAQAQNKVTIPLVKDSNKSVITALWKNANQLIVGIIAVFIVKNQE